MPGKICDSIEPMLAAYTLGALDEHERAAVEAHIKTCEACRARHASLNGTLAAVATSLRQQVPPARVAQRLADFAHAVRPAPLTGWRTGLRPALGWAAASALSVAALVLFAQLSSLANHQTALTTHLAQQQLAIKQYARECTNQASLAATPLAADARALLKFSPGEHLGVLEVSSLATLPAAQTYQLWLIDSAGKTENGGLFQMPPTPDQQIAIFVVAQSDFKNYVRFGVTVEPAAGSVQPTGPAVFGSL